MGLAESLINKNAKLEKGQEVALQAIGLESLLAGSKVVVGLLSGSVVLISDAVHSVSDLLPIFASWLGLKISQKDPDEKFPYGYYKAENLASLLVSLLVFYAGFRVLKNGINLWESFSTLQRPFLAMTVSLVDAVVLYFFGSYEEKIGRKINSRSLQTMGKENKTHLFTSSSVLIGVLVAYLQIPYLEALFTIGISFLIFEIAFSSAKDAVFALMDVGIDEEKYQQVGASISSVPGIEEYYDLRLRRSGPFIFGETKVGIRKQIEVQKAHVLADQVEQAVKEVVSEIDSFTVHVEPFSSQYSHLVIPVKSKAGLQAGIGEKFGRAPYFLFVNLKGSEIKGSYTLENKHRDKQVRAGLAAAKMINKQKSTVVIVKQIGEITFHFLRDYLFDIYKTDVDTAKQAVNKYLSQKLSKINRPTKEIV